MGFCSLVLLSGSASQYQAFYDVSSVGGPASNTNAYHAELSLLVALDFFCQQKQINEGGITIGCDNQGAIWQDKLFLNRFLCHSSC